MIAPTLRLGADLYFTNTIKARDEYKLPVITDEPGPIKSVLSFGF
jgi:hypothetical protein